MSFKDEDEEELSPFQKVVHNNTRIRMGVWNNCLKNTLKITDKIDIEKFKKTTLEQDYGKETHRSLLVQLNSLRFQHYFGHDRYRNPNDVR